MKKLALTAPALALAACQPAYTDAQTAELEARDRLEVVRVCGGVLVQRDPETNRLWTTISGNGTRRVATGVTVDDLCSEARPSATYSEAQ